MRKHAAKAAAMMAALSHESRLRVLCDLVTGERTAGDLVERSGLSQSALSQHLGRLREEGLVAIRREGATSCPLSRLDRETLSALAGQNAQELT